MWKILSRLFFILPFLVINACGTENDVSSTSNTGVDYTTISKPLDVAVDPINNEIFVANNMNDSITVFERTANGNVTPKRKIKGTTTNIHWPSDLVIDPVHHELIIANQLSNTISGFLLTAADDVSPLWHQFLYVGTGEADIIGFDINIEHNVLIACDGLTGSLASYPLTGTGKLNYYHRVTVSAFSDKGPIEDVMIDNVNKNIFVLFEKAVAVYPLDFTETTDPLRTITSVDISSGTKIAIDTINNEFAITNSKGNNIIFFPLTASGDINAIRKISGPLTQLDVPYGVAIDAIHNEVFITNINNNSVTVYTRTTNGNNAPLRIIKGPDKS